MEAALTMGRDEAPPLARCPESEVGCNFGRWKRLECCFLFLGWSQTDRPRKVLQFHHTRPVRVLPPHARKGVVATADRGGALGARDGSGARRHKRVAALGRRRRRATEVARSAAPYGSGSTRWRERRGVDMAANACGRRRDGWRACA